jgi:hypothetical protein
MFACQYRSWLQSDTPVGSVEACLADCERSCAAGDKAASKTRLERKKVVVTVCCLKTLPLDKHAPIGLVEAGLAGFERSCAAEGDCYELVKSQPSYEA